jgi:hypothetical protein
MNNKAIRNIGIFVFIVIISGWIGALKEYDAYYHYHGDTNYRMKITFSSGEREGNIIRLFYNDTFMAGGGDKVLTLREKEAVGYLFVSNQKAEGTP